VIHAIDLIQDAEFTIGQKVYSRANPDECGFVVAYRIEATALIYAVRWSDYSEAMMHDFELSDTKVIEGTD
jgi:hypothetical protein